MTKPARLALVGAGSMSVHHARVISQSERAFLDVVVDPDEARARELAKTFECRAATELEAALPADAVVIASSTESHVEVALKLLAEDVPLLIEKPIATALEDVRRVLDEAEARAVPLACGFAERFNPVIASARDHIEDPPIHIVALRHSPVTPRATASVVHDLLIHDIDLAIRLAGDQIHQARGWSWKPEGAQVPEVADCTIQFATGAIATLSSSRTSHRKIRNLFIETPDKLIELDLLRQDISIYRHVRHAQVMENATTYRAETVIDIPFVRQVGEPVALQLDHFLDLAAGRADPVEERRGLLAPHEVAARVERRS